MSDMDATRILATGGGGTATLQMPAGGLDPMRTQMGGTLTCPICKSTTPLADPYCGECGFLLASPALSEDLELPTSAAVGCLVGGDGRRIQLQPGSNTVGRTGTDVILDDATVSRVHATVVIDDAGATITDLGSTNGTKVDESRLGANEPLRVADGAKIRFGSSTYVLELAANPGDADLATVDETTDEVASGEATTAADEPAEDIREPQTLGTLKSVDGHGAQIKLVEGETTVGRRPDNTVVVAGDPYVSGRHATFQSAASAVSVTDLNSSNGTTVNGQTLVAGEPMVLVSGDDVKIGQTTYRFEAAVDIDQAVPAAEPEHEGPAAEDQESA